MDDKAKKEFYQKKKRVEINLIEFQSPKNCFTRSRLICKKRDCKVLQNVLLEVEN